MEEAPRGKAIEVQAVAKHFGPFTALQSVTFDIHDNEFFTLLGPSGCGKTTLLRMLAGFEAPSEGTIRLHGRDIIDLPPVRSGAEVRRDDRVELASAVAPASKPKAAAAAVAEEPLARSKKPDPLGDYGYSTDYRRLRGRLEYLEKEQCWKLRYIPIDGATDQYGGSVVLEQSGALAGYRRGDLVEVRGELSARAADGKDFAPAYQVADIRALGH